MAIYRCEAKIITRGNGHSAVAAAAYRTGTKIRDERTGTTKDYSGRKGVVQTVILRPENSPDWSAHTASLWNQVERGEKRKDAQLAREFILAVPRELSASEQWQCAVAWAQSELVAKGMIAEVSLHHPNQNNPHVHILATLRTIEGDKFSAKKAREWNDKALLVHWRESWAGAVNAALEKAGRPERVDHRSLKEQGVDRIPEPKLGKAKGMKERGALEDPERFKLLRKVKLLNEAMPFIRAIQRCGEIQHYGMGRWFDKTRFFFSRVRDQAASAVKRTWQKVFESQRDRGPDRER